MLGRIILANLIKIDVYLYPGGMWEAMKTLPRSGNGLWEASGFPPRWSPDSSSRSKSLVGCLPSSPTETRAQEGNKYAGALVRFRILSSDYRFTSDLVMQAASQGVGWAEMLTKHGGFWAGDQGEAVRAATAAR